jgi:hypothetical protein
MIDTSSAAGSVTRVISIASFPRIQPVINRMIQAWKR